jgi:hypothetical protein
VRERAAELAAAASIAIQHIANSHIRKDDVVAEVLAGRGDHPGLVQVISAMEACPTYKPWNRLANARIITFYFIDAKLGLIYLRVPHLVSVPPPVLLQRT